MACAVRNLSAHNSAATDEHWNAGMDVLRYLKGAPRLAVKFKGSDDYILDSFGDSDLAGDLRSCKSFYGCIFSASGCLISWTSRKSSIVGMSTTIAELNVFMINLF